MRYEMLGPARIVADDGEPHAITSAKTQVLMCSLLNSPRGALASEQLIVEMWGEDPPNRVRTGLHVYVSQSRKLLAGVGAASEILTVPGGGYRLEQGTDSWDVGDAEHWLQVARHEFSRGRHRQAERAADTALALWRGRPRRAGHGPISEGFYSWEEELRLSLDDISVAAHVARGADEHLVTRLRSLVASHPLRESFYHQLMLALYQCNRQAEALMVFHQARTVLDDELGVLPGATLIRAHQAILQGSVNERLLASQSLGPVLRTSA